MSETSNETNPHKQFFHVVFSRIEYAAELLQLGLPADLQLYFDWNQLTLEEDTFKNEISDLVFSVPFKADPENEVKIFILLVHQAYQDPHLFKQLLLDITLILKHSIKQTGRPAPVIPVVFYHGEEKWRSALSFQDTYFPHLPDYLKQYTLNFKIILIDTHVLVPQEVL